VEVGAALLCGENACGKTCLIYTSDDRPAGQHRLPNDPTSDEPPCSDERTRLKALNVPGAAWVFRGSTHGDDQSISIPTIKKQLRLFFIFYLLCL